MVSSIPITRKVATDVYGWRIAFLGKMILQRQYRIEKKDLHKPGSTGNWILVRMIWEDVKKEDVRDLPMYLFASEMRVRFTPAVQTITINLDVDKNGAHFNHPNINPDDESM